MIYMKSEGPSGVRVIVLESANLGELLKGRPAATPDKSVVISWTPDAVWLGAEIMKVKDGDLTKIAELIELSQLRPEVERPRAGETTRHTFERDKPDEPEVNVDLSYALKQLRGIDLGRLQQGNMSAADRVQRAIDALERLEEAGK